MVSIEIINLGRHHKWVILFNCFYLCILMIIINYNIFPINVSLKKVNCGS